ncbi:MAG: hypothetical protein ACOX7I_04015 [Oscillospiraceae bacterium]
MKGSTTEGYRETIAAKVKKCLDWLDRRPVLQLIVVSNILNLIIEMLSRKSAAEGIKYLFKAPLVFEYNALIILLTLSMSLLISKKNFALLCISAVWLGLGTANCILLNYRITPIAATDFQVLRSVWEIIGDYLEIWQIVLICMCLLVFVSAVILIGNKSPKRKVQYAKALATVTVSALALVLSTAFSLKADAISTSFGNLADAYQEYGFAYCFSSSVIDRGIDRPEQYSEEKIRKILKAIKAASPYAII